MRDYCCLAWKLPLSNEDLVSEAVVSVVSGEVQMFNKPLAETLYHTVS